MPFGIYNPIEYGTPINNTSIAQLITTVGDSLQKRFDLNDAKIQENIQKVLAIPLGRDKDRQYLNDKVNTLLNSVNQQMKLSGGRSLLSGSATAQINSYISSVTQDPYLKKQIQNSVAEQNFMKGMTDLRAKKPEEYNDTNYGYALEKANYMKWKSGESDDLGTLSYLSYRDVMGNAMKKAKEFKDLKGDTVVEMPDPNDPTQTIKTTVNGLTPEEIIKNIPGFVSPQDEQQLVIDGWGKYKGNVQAAQRDFDAITSTKQAQLEEAIKEQEAIINSGKYNDDYNSRAEDLKKKYQTQLKNLQEHKVKVDKNNIDQLGYTIVKEQLTNTMSNLFSGHQSTVVGVNEGYFKKANLLMEQQKFDMEAEKFQMAKEEHRAKMLKEYGTGTGTDLGTAYSVSPEVNQETPDADFYQAAKDSHNEAYNTIISTGMAAYNDKMTTADDRINFRKTLKLNGYDIGTSGNIIPLAGYKGAPQSKANAVKQAFFDSGMEQTHIESSEVISQAASTKEALAAALIEVERDMNLSGIKAVPKNISEKFKNVNVANLTGGVLPFLAETVKFGKSVLGDKKLQEASETTKAQMGQKLKSVGVLPYITMKNTANVINEGVRQGITDRIVQTEGSTSATFDPKRTMTVRKVADGIEITQEQGAKTDKDGNIVPQPVAKYTAPKGSDLYNYIEKGLDLTGSKSMDARSVPKNYTITNIKKPTFIDTTLVSRLDSFNDSFNTLVKDNAIKSSGIQNYATKPLAVKQMQTIFGTKYSVDQLQNIVNKVDEGFKNGVYTVELQPNNYKNWITVLSKNGKPVYSDYASQGTEMNNSYFNLVQQHPQLVIMDKIVKMLQLHPEKINTL